MRQKQRLGTVAWTYVLFGDVLAAPFQRPMQTWIPVRLCVRRLFVVRFDNLVFFFNVHRVATGYQQGFKFHVKGGGQTHQQIPSWNAADTKKSYNDVETTSDDSSN